MRGLLESFLDLDQLVKAKFWRTQKGELHWHNPVSDKVEVFNPSHASAGQGPHEEIDNSGKYPRAGASVSGLAVLSDVPNMSSIDATFGGTNYQVLPGIREVSMSEFGGPKSVFYSSDDFKRSAKLAEEIKQSGQIKPLIIAVDHEGPYILEGAHRYVALHALGVESFPAKIVLEEGVEEDPIEDVDDDSDEEEKPDFGQDDFRGEWWVDESGQSTYADGDVGDADHANTAFSAALGISFDDPDVPEMYPHHKLSPEAIKYLQEQGVDQKAIDWFARGKDPRDYAMRHMGWTRVKNNMFQTHEFNDAALRNIQNFVYENIEKPEESDKEVTIEDMSTNSVYDIPVKYLAMERATAKGLKAFAERRRGA